MRLLATTFSASSFLQCLPLLLLPVASGQSESSSSSTGCFPPTIPKGLGVHEDGSALYVLDAGSGLLEYNAADGEFVGVVTDETTAEGGMQVLGDAIFVSAASSSGGTVEKFNLAGSLLQTFPSSSSSSSTSAAAPGGYDVAVADDGSVFVSNFLSDGVEVYDGTTGEHLRQELGDVRALGIAFGPDGLLYAAVNGEDQVRRFMMSSDSGNYTQVDAFISGGSGSRVRSGPWGVAVNQEDYLVYVSWAGSKELTEYSSSGAELRWWFPGQGTGATVAGADDDDASAAGGETGTVLSPWYVAVDGSGNVYASAQNEDEIEADVFKYDGATGDEVGRLSECWGGATTSSTTSSSSTAPPSATPTGAPATTPSPLAPGKTSSPSPTASPTSPVVSAETPAPTVEATAETTLGTPAPSVEATSETTVQTPAPSGETVGGDETPGPVAVGEEASTTSGAAAGRRVARVPEFAAAAALVVFVSQMLML